MLEKKQKFVPEFFPSTNSFTIYCDFEVIDSEVSANGGLIATGRHSMAFTCNMLEEMKKYIGDDNHDAVKAASVMWTPSVVAKFWEVQKSQVVESLKQRWLDLPGDKEKWSNEQIQAFNDNFDVAHHLPLNI